MSKPSYYSITPAYIRYDKTLPMGARFLYGEITALANDKGFCWASNRYFAELYDVSSRTVSRWMTALSDKKYISMDVVPGEQRRIFLCDGWTKMSYPHDKNVHTPRQKCRTPHDKNVVHNNTFNNTLNNTSINKATREKTPLKKASPLNNEIANGETAFTAPAPVNGATLFVGFCQENGFKRLLSWPKPLKDERFRQLKDQHGEAVFTAELEKINNVYSRTVKDCHRTVLNWFKRLQPPPPPHVETCYQIWRDGYRQKHGLYPTSSKFDNRNIEQMTAELAAMQPDQNVVDVWRQWCDMLFTMKPEGKNGFSWSPQLLTALSKNFSKITLDMKKSVNGGSLQSQAEKDADFMAEAMQEYERLQREKQNKYA